MAILKNLLYLWRLSNMSDIFTYIENLRKQPRPEPVDPENQQKAEAWDALTEVNNNE